MRDTSIHFPGLLLAGRVLMLLSLGRVAAGAGAGIITFSTSTAYAQDKSATIQEVSYLPPNTFAQMLQSSDVVARVRIADAKANFVGPADSGIFSEITATVVEPYKLKPTATPVAAGAAIRILQEGGEAQVGAKRLRIVAEFERLSKGKEYVLFLTWNKPINAYQVNYGPDGAFEIAKGQKLRAIGKSTAAQEQGGVEIAAFQQKVQQSVAAQSR
jgi:hypothetical protein